MADNEIINHGKAPDLGGVFERIAKKDAPTPLMPAKNLRAQEPEDKKSLTALRDNLSAYPWVKGEVYRISAKFFSKRSAAEIDEQYNRLLSSLHFLDNPQENADLALKVILDEMTSAEAMKASLSRQGGAELKRSLETVGWPADRVARLAAKYAGEKTAADLEARYRIILSELTNDGCPTDNRDLALDVLEDAGRYESAKEEAARRVYAKQLSRLLDLPLQGVEKLSAMFFGKKPAEWLLDECREINEQIRFGQYPKGFAIAVSVICGEISKDNALLQTRALKNQEDISHLAGELALTQKQAAKISANYAKPQCEKWFDEEFLSLFSSLPGYEDSDRKNALLAALVMAEEITRDSALEQAQHHARRENAQSHPKQEENQKERHHGQTDREERQTE